MCLNTEMWYVFLFHRLDLDVAWTDLHDAVNSGELASMVVRVVSRLTAHLDLRAFEGGGGGGERFNSRIYPNPE